LDILKVVDNKFSVGEDEGSENTWAKVAGKHVEAKRVFNLTLILELYNMLMELSPVISDVVTKLFNILLASADVPPEWKLASVTPIFKNR